MLISGAVMFFLILIPSGPFLPANYAEQQLINTKETLQEADITEEEMIPSGSLYGVFDREGSFLYGTFDEEVQKDAWKNIKQILYTLRERDIIFLWKNNGEICIIKYFVAMRYAKEKLNEILPSPETFNMILTLGVFITLTVLNGCYLSGKFGRKLKNSLPALLRQQRVFLKMIWNLLLRPLRSGRWTRLWLPWKNERGSEGLSENPVGY